MSRPPSFDKRASSASLWPSLRRLVAIERRIAAWTSRRPATAFAYEFLRFGVKQGWACLFGGTMVALLVGAHWFYPRHAWLARYDFLFLAALAVQAFLLAAGMELWEEAKVILVYHVIGTAMEVFKTKVGSWIYPEPCFFHLGGVPLFSGFMYASIGSYVARAWRLFDFRFAKHPSPLRLGLLSAAIYLNFFVDHYHVDLRPVLFLAAVWLIGPTTLFYRIWRKDRRMPLLLGLCLVALFIWFAENLGTLGGAWLYPHQLAGWAPVRLAKLGSWLLLLIVSYTLVAAVNRPAAWTSRRAASTPGPARDGETA